MSQRVLLVEDNDILRRLMAEAVTPLGYPAVECSNGHDALGKLNA